MSYDDSITNTKIDGSKLTPTWMNNMQDALGSGHPQLSSDWIVYYDATDAVYRGRNGDDGSVDSENTAFQTVFSDVMGFAVAGEVITFKGNISVASECNITKAVTMDCYGAIFTWTGAAGTGPAPLDMFKATTVVNGLKILGGKYLTNSKNVFPFGSLVLTNSIIKDITINHTIRTTLLTDVKFENIVQLGGYGDAGYDCGINITGTNVTVDGFYADLATTYQGCFVINYVNQTVANDIPWDNIILKHIYVEGNFGSLVQWYIYDNDDKQYVGGRTLIEDFEIIMAVPTYPDFAPFLCVSELTAGAFSGHFGDITIKNGKIKGPSAQMSNGIPESAFFDIEVTNLNAAVKLTVDNIEITGMQRGAATDVVIPNLQNGTATLSNIRYTNTGVSVKLLLDYLNPTIIMDQWNVNTGANAIALESDAAGTNTLVLTNNVFSAACTITVSVGATTNLYYLGNTGVIATAGPGTLVFSGIQNLPPTLDGTYYLGTWSPKHQWKGLYLSDDGYIIWENDAKISRSAANELEVDATIKPHNATQELGQDVIANRWALIHLGTGVKVAGIQVVGAQQAAIADLGTSGADEDGTCRGKVNAILARLRAHGLIDT